VWLISKKSSSKLRFRISRKFEDGINDTEKDADETEKKKLAASKAEVYETLPIGSY
jgi:hypothetical protein